MKLYCIEQDNCGTIIFRRGAPLDSLDEEDLICPDCYSLMLPYQDTKEPAWRARWNKRIGPSADAEDGDG